MSSRAEAQIPTNVMSFNIPGFDQTLYVQFPGSRLPVCDACKRQFKTRDMCRVRSKHTGAPWTPVYICLTLDESCTDGRGMLVHDKPLVCRTKSQSATYCAPASFFARKDKPPVCGTCKKANRAKKTCRGQFGHRQLPWSTVYVVLSTAESVDPMTVVAPPSQPTDIVATSLYAPSAEDTTDNLSASMKPPPTGHTGSTSMNPSVTGLEDVEEYGIMHRGGLTESPFVDETAIVSKASHESPSSLRSEGTFDGHNVSSGTASRQGAFTDNLYPIPSTRTMLLSVSCEQTTITWLESPRSAVSSTKGNVVHPWGSGGTHRHGMTMQSPTFAREQHTAPTHDLQPYPLTQNQYPLIATNDSAFATGSLPFVDIFMGVHDHNHVMPNRQDYIHPQPPPAQSTQEHQHHYGHPTQLQSSHPQGTMMAGAQLASTMLRPAQRLPVPSHSRVTAGEAAAAAAAERGRRKPDHDQMGPPSPDPPPPPAILPQLQNPTMTQSSDLLNSQIASPGIWDFRQQQMPPPPVQFYPIPQSAALNLTTEVSALDTTITHGSGGIQQLSNVGQLQTHDQSSNAANTPNQDITVNGPTPSVPIAPRIGPENAKGIQETFNSISQAESVHDENEKRKRRRVD